MTMTPEDLHVFFLPFLAPGHMIPMVDLACIVASRGVKVTIVTTNGNAPLIQPTLDRSPHFINLLTLPLSSSVQNLVALPSPELTPEFITALDSLEYPFRDLLKEHHPDIIVSDIFYPWTADLGITRLTFHGSSVFSTIVVGAINMLKLHEAVQDDHEPFIVPEMPHRIELTRTQLMDGITKPNAFDRRLAKSFWQSYGMIMNTFYGLESAYIKMIQWKVWHVGPVSFHNRDAEDRAVRGGGSGVLELCLNWLDDKKPGSVLYICFGSLGRSTCSQLREIAIGLEASGHSFIWVIKNCGDKAEWMPENFEERVNCLIITGWAPQILILNHKSIGGFMTHCGWNSCLEGASAGLPMITWPLFAEQFFNEKLLVTVLRIGVSVGTKVCSYDEKKRDLVKSEEVKRAVDEVMGSGEEAEERRKRAKVVAMMAKKAMEEGGSSYNEISRLIQELMDVKAGKVVGKKSSVKSGWMLYSGFRGVDSYM